MDHLLSDGGGGAGMNFSEYGLGFRVYCLGG